MRIYKPFSGHFIYVVIALFWAIFTGEDFNTVFFFTSLAFYISLILYIYNCSVYITCDCFLPKNSIISFIAAPILMCIFFKVFKSMIAGFDIGGDYIAYFIILITFLVNLATYFKFTYRKESL